MAITKAVATMLSPLKTLDQFKMENFKQQLLSGETQDAIGGFRHYFSQ
jgi:hypothetical protein